VALTDPDGVLLADADGELLGDSLGLVLGDDDGELLATGRASSAPQVNSLSSSVILWYWNFA